MSERRKQVHFSRRSASLRASLRQSGIEYSGSLRHGFASPAPRSRAIFARGWSEIDAANFRFCFFILGEWFEFSDHEDVSSLRTMSINMKVKGGSYSHFSYSRSREYRARTGHPRFGRGRQEPQWEKGGPPVPRGENVGRGAWTETFPESGTQGENTTCLSRIFSLPLHSSRLFGSQEKSSSPLQKSRRRISDSVRLVEMIQKQLERAR
jgi:hypothetical protein